VGFKHGDGASMEEPMESCQEHIYSDSCIPRSLRQQDFTKAHHICKRKQLDEKWAAFFYGSNVTFNVARHSAFIAAMKATSVAGFDYTPPMYHAMQNKHIEPKVKQVKAETENATKQSIALYRATMCSNGWNNQSSATNECHIGLSSRGVFIDSVDMTSHKKTKECIAEELKSYIEAVGLNNVTQIYSYNTSAMLGTLDELVALSFYLYKQGCCAHILDFLFED
jgi:hypothetical protein